MSECIIIVHWEEPALSIRIKGHDKDMVCLFGRESRELALQYGVKKGFGHAVETA